MPNYATNIALVNSDNVVENLIWGMFYSIDEYSSWGYNAIQIDDLGVAIGDTYVNGQFINSNGEVVISREQQHENEIAELDAFIIDALYADIIADLEE